jgi:hypothetical protein
VYDYGGAEAVSAERARKPLEFRVTAARFGPSAILDASEPEPAQAKWFRALGQEIKEEYDRLHQEALEDPQRAGHGGEATWVSVFKKWLPPAYPVLTREYIIPEIGTEKFEMDIVVLHPSYPEPLRSREEILAGGVAAAFSVRLTLDAAGIRDGVKRAVALRRAMQPRHGTPRKEMTAPFPVGMLAHTHDWKAPNSTPAANILSQFQSLDSELAGHPRESLDYLCVADLGFWSVLRMPYMPPMAVEYDPGASEHQRMEGAASTVISQTSPSQTFTAVAQLITHLFVHPSYFDPMLRPLADNLRLTGTSGSSSGENRLWDLNCIFRIPCERSCHTGDCS